MKKLLHSNISIKTAAIYKKLHKEYKQFTKILKLVTYSEKSMCLYVCHLSEFRSYNHIIKCICAIKHFRTLHRKPKTMRQLKQILQGIKRNIAKVDSRPTRLPITPEKLITIKNHLCSNKYNKFEERLYWCAYLFAYYGFLRVSEFTNPQV